MNKQDFGFFLAMTTFGIVPLVFNIPKIPFKGFSELEVRILDNNGKIIKKYSAEKTSYIKHSIWNQCQHCMERAKWEAYETALGDILEQIYKDRIWLSKQLKKSL